MKALRLIIFFGLIGSLGFLIDTAILYLLKDTLGLFYARILSFTSSALSTWLLNSKFTFKEHRSGLNKPKEILFYFILMLIGGSINYGVYVLTVLSNDFAFNNPIVGVAAGSICGMFVNLLSSKFLLFKRSAAE